LCVEQYLLLLLLIINYAQSHISHTVIT